MGVNTVSELFIKALPRRGADAVVNRAAAKAASKVAEDAGRVTMKADSLILSRASAPAQASVLHLDAQRPEIQQIAEDLGWTKQGKRFTLMNDGTFLHYTSDAGRSWRDVPLQYLADNRQGFLFRDLPPNTPVDYSLHVELGSTHNGFYSYDDKAERWLNSWGHNSQGLTQPNPSWGARLAAPAKG